MKSFIQKSALLYIFLIFLNCYHSKKDNTAVMTLLSQRVPPVRVTIVGDSLSQWSNGFGLKQKLAPSYLVSDISMAGYDTELWLGDLAKAEAIQTDIWIIELGTNDASYKGTNGFRDRYTQILRRLEQHSYSYFILSTVPKTNQVGLHPAISTNNELIRNLVRSNERYRLADLEAIFSAAPDGTILYSVADPIHPNQIGYEMIGAEYKRILLGL